MALNPFYASVTKSPTLEERKPFGQFFRGLFPDGQPDASEYVSFDKVENGGAGVATYVSPLHKSQLVENRGSSLVVFKPALTKEHKITEAHKLLEPGPGEVFGGDKSAEQRAAAKAAADLAELQDRIFVAQEVQSAGAMLSGSFEIDGVGVKKTLDFGRHASLKPAAKAGTARWGESAAKVLDDIGTICGLVETYGNGLLADNIVFGRKALSAFRDDATVQKILDVRRMEMGEFRPGAIVNGARYIGYLADPGVNLWLYTGTYQDASGATVALMPTNKILAWSSAAKRSMHYGPIPIPGGAFVGKAYSYAKEIDDPATTQLHVQSSFLALPWQPNGAASLQVMDLA